MIYNKYMRLIGTNVILIPYRKHHVEKYHQWMQSEQLQKLTASEPLTLAEEYEMQNSWENDEDKCTFIILDKNRYENTRDEVASMIGDTNLFFMNQDSRLMAEAEIMIAEDQARGRHCGWEAIILMLVFGIENLGVKHYVVKISSDNLISIKMFEKLGFTETCSSEVFKEITCEKIVSDQWINWLKGNLVHFKIDDNYL